MTVDLSAINSTTQAWLAAHATPDNFHALQRMLIIFAAQYLYLAVLGLAVLYFLMAPMSRRRRMLLLGSIGLPLVWLAAEAAGRAYFDPRPFVAGHFVPLIPHAPDNGFPSDHALITSAAAMLVLLVNHRWGVMLWALAVLVGLARVLAGLHHPLDVAGSFAISIAVFLVVRTLLRWVHLLPRPSAYS